MRRRLGVGVAVAALAAVLVGVPAAGGAAQEHDAAGHDVRITARRVAGERVEFGLQQRDADGAWGGRVLPDRRFFALDTAVGRWLVSSPLSLSGGAPEARITARRVADGRVEFALQHRPPVDEDELARDAEQRRSYESRVGGELADPPVPQWQPQLLPTQRFFPPATAAGRWLVSTPLQLPDVSDWGVVPWDADFYAGYIESYYFTVACGFYEGEYGQCHDPADTETFDRFIADLYQCEIDRATSMCVGLGGAAQAIWNSWVACPAGWSISHDTPIVYDTEECFHPEHPDYVEWDREY